MKRSMLTLFLLLGAIFSVAETVEEIFMPMRQEMSRAMKGLRFEDYPQPYFISLRTTQERTYQAGFRDGAKNFSNQLQRWFFVPEVRVGSYEFDQSPDQWTGWTGDHSISFSSNPLLTRHLVRNALDEVYKNSCELYYSKKARRSAEGVPEYAAEDFTSEKFPPPVNFSLEGDSPIPDFSFEDQEAIAASISLRLASNPKVLRSLARFDARQSKAYFLSSEGAEYRSNWNHYSLYLSLFGRSARGLQLHLTKTFHARHLEDLPSLKDAEKAVEDLHQSFLELYSSSEAVAGVAPCLIEADGAGAFFLSFVSRLEAERQGNPYESHTFRDKIGKSVLPEFLTIKDDPTKERIGTIRLMGHYDRDEEGVPAQSVLLVDKGILRNFLMSRRPVKGAAAKSNGHGRAGPSSRAHARAANLIISSTRMYSKEEVRIRLLEEVRRRGLPFGVRISGIDEIKNEDRAGSHQTIRASPQKMYFVYPDGHEHLVHNGEVVGTPIKLIQSIVATGKDTVSANSMDNGISGSLPVSVTAPSLLLSEIEIQKGSERPLRPPILPSPLEK